LSKSAETARRDVKGARIAVFDEDPLLPLARDVKDAVVRAADTLEKQGAKVKRIKSPVDMRELLVNYVWLLNSIIGAGFPEHVHAENARTRDADLKAFAASRDPWSRELGRLATGAQASEVMMAQRARQQMKDRMATFFQSCDAIVMPISPVTAFKHDHSEPFHMRQLDVDGKAVAYPNMLGWIALATALHLPALAVPAGRSASNMPVGVQVVGPLDGEDRLFDFAAAIEDGIGGFEAPRL
jgi:amidase